MKNLRVQPDMSALAAAEIRSAILSGELAPATRITQEELAEKLGVSRQPIRHALLMLEREGLVRVMPKRRAIVTPLERQLILDIYDLREAVEPHITARVAQNAPDIEPLESILREGRAAVRAGRLSRLIDLDLDFHNAIYQAAGNRTVADLMQMQFSHLRRGVHIILTAKGYPEKAWNEHAEIVAAIAHHRPQRARSIARAHIVDARGLLAARFGTVGFEGQSQ